MNDFYSVLTNSTWHGFGFHVYAILKFERTALDAVVEKGLKDLVQVELFSLSY